jgi:hypothetical protein
MFDNKKQRKMNIYDSLIKYETKTYNKHLKLNFLTNRNTTLLTDHNELLNNLISLLKNIIENKNKFEITADKKENSIQTDFFPYFDEKFENEKIELENAYNKLKTDYDRVFIELEILKKDFNKIQKENDEWILKHKELCEKFNTASNALVLALGENKILKEENTVMKSKLEDRVLMQGYIETHKDYKKAMGDIFERKNYSTVPNLESIVIKNEKALGICKYLSPLDIINLKHSSKKLYLHIDSHSNLSKFLYFGIIKRKNKIINELKLETSEDDIIEHEEEEIESLLRKHKKEEQDIYKDFGVSIMNSVEFIYNDIKSNNKLNGRDIKETSYIKGVTSLFSGLFQTPSNNNNNHNNIRSGQGQSFSTSGKSASNKSSLSFNDMVRIFIYRRMSLS